MKSIINWLLNPYHLLTKIKSKIIISFGIGFFVFGFLLLFKPFEFYKLTGVEMYSYALMYGTIATSVILFNYTILPLIFTSFFKSYKWNIGKMVLFVLSIIILTGVCNWVFSGYSSFNEEKSDYGFLFFQITAFLVGVFPLLLYIYFTEKIDANKNKKVAHNIAIIQKRNPILINEKKAGKIIIKLIGENKNEELSINLQDLIFINSEKNYASIFHLENNKIKEILIRTSLNKIENQLLEHVNIVRCHKSYIVNTNHVEEIQGNARGYLLKLTKPDKLIPVSRSFPKELLITLVK